MDLGGRQVSVLGAGKSGLAASELLLSCGARVVLWDERAPDQLGAEALASRGVMVRGGAPLGPVDLGRPDLVVVSPGVPLRLPSIVRAREDGVPIWGEIELAARFLPPGALVLGVTGTNGKSTTTALLGALCQAGGLDAFVGGNLGTPLSRAVLEAPRRTYVLELSSFQLEGTETVRVHGAAVLNLTPDHLDRYDGMEDYAAAKARIFRNQEPADVAVVNADDRWTVRMLEGTRGRPCGFTLEPGLVPRREFLDLAEGSEAGFLIVEAGVRLRVLNRALRGRHNLANAMAASLLAFHAGVSREALQIGLDAFPGLSHRIESIRTLDGVEWINDSKATNVDAVLTALAAFPAGQRLWLIAGGKGKGAPYRPLVDAAVGKVAGVLTVGQDAPLLEAEFSPVLPVHPCETLDRAVARARALARRGDVVLLSPACASYDQFRNFEHRGDTFRALVEALS
ncbi:MAG TPA: UDP-N-acetylmuramoyl-L-alanine--D-glutamate ligase [Myxococcaceae bacterium]|nr:UDP-N-acetylmuramoyl-L-alanine--D-glutamate ligase [Myxococcaceae bacterium]